MVQVQYMGKAVIFDPSYGQIYVDLNDFEKKAIAYYGIAPKVGNDVVLALRANPGTDDIQRDPTVKGY